MTKEVFIKNRNRLFEFMESESILVLFSRNNNEDASKYDINRNFYYASGLIEFKDILVLSNLDGRNCSYIFINRFDPVEAKWVGVPFSKEEVKNITGIEDIYYLDEFDGYLSNVLPHTKNAYFDLDRDEYVDYITEDELFSDDIADNFPEISIASCHKFFAVLRREKDPEEIEMLRKAISITNKGLEAVYQNCKPGLYEYQIESFFDAAIKYNGATGFSFPTISASGKNGTCLHYSDNTDVTKDGDLLLMDLGASYHLYNADITRTFPVNGKFTERQKQIYNIVLEGQRLVFEAIKPGVTTRDLNNVLVNYYCKVLKEIGLIKENSEVGKYYYHGVSHHLGLETHDFCEYTPLVPGCVITVEPGLYIEEEGIGIRIEDDALVTENGSINLSQEIIKTVEDIENYIGENNYEKK